jgi:hypothetical protein
MNDRNPVDFRRLLRLNMRRNGREQKTGDEIAPLHSITSSRAISRGD